MDFETHPELFPPQRPRWPLAIVGIGLFFALLAFLLSAGGGGGNDDVPFPAAQAGSAETSLTTDAGDDLLASATGSLAKFAGSLVDATAVPVHSLVGDAALWVGTDERRVFVVVDEPTFASVKPATGMKLSFIGELQKNVPGEANGTTGADAALLKRQAVHILASGSDLEDAGG